MGVETAMPKRIQRRRTKGWRMPEDAVYVGRGSKWGNPFTKATVRGCACNTCLVARYQVDLSAKGVEMIRSELAGKDLACWCPLDRACHADALLELANDDATYRYAIEQKAPETSHG